MTDEVEPEYEQFMKALGARIKQFRQERGLSLRDMVVKHDYHDSQWRRFERSGVGSVSSLLKIAKAFNTSVSILLDGLGQYPAANVAQLQKKQAATDAARSTLKNSNDTNRRVSSERRSIPDRRKN